MEYVNFGKAGVKVSQLALGLGLRGQADESEARRLIEHTLDLGINLIDCANYYSPGNTGSNIGGSEIVLGKALKGRRGDVVITSKVYTYLGDGPNDGGTSRYHIMREVENSLRRLNTDRIDVYLLHNYDLSTPLEETIRALDDLVRQGKVLYVGCSNFTAWKVCESLWIADRLNATPFMCLQNQYSLLNRTLEEEMFGLVRDQGLGVMVYSPLAVGLLSGIYRPSESPPPNTPWSKVPKRIDSFNKAMSGPTADVLETVNTIANEIGKSMAQVAIAWVLSKPEITVAISGSDTIEHIEENVGALGWDLPQEAVEKLDEVSARIVGSIT